MADNLPDGLSFKNPNDDNDLPDGLSFSNPQVQQPQALPFMDKPPETESLMTQLGSATNEAIANIGGLPMDASRGIANMMGAEIPTDAWGGSEYIRNQLKDTGFIQPESQDPLLQGARRAGRMATEAVLPLGIASKFAATVRSPILKEALTSVISNPARVLGLEALSGASAGVSGQVAREFTDNPLYIAAAELGGGLTPTGVMAATGGLTRKALGAGKGGAVAKTVEDFASIGATPTVSQATGKGAGLEKISKTIPFGGKRFEDNAQKTRDAIQKTIDKNLTDIGGVHTRQGTGQVIQKGLKSGGITDRTHPDFDFNKLGYLEREIVRSGDLYDDAARLLPDDFKVTMPNTSAAARDILRDLGDAPSYSQGMQGDKVSSKARQILSDLETSAFMPYDTIKKIRSDIGEIMSEMNTSQKSKFKKLYAGLSKDMDGATELLSGEAKSAAKKANNHYKRYMQNIDENLKPLLNKNDPSHISNFLDRSGKQGAAQLRSVKRSLKPDEWNTYVSYQLDQLGKATASKQDDLGGVFSTETFLTNWNKMADETKTVLFNNKPEMRRDFDAIANVVSKVRKSESALANPSGTAKLLTGVGLTSAGGVGAATMSFPVVAALTAGLGANKMLSVAMTSPKTLNWLAKGVNMRPEAMAGHITRLAIIAQRGDQDDQEAALEIINILSPSEAK